MPTRSSTIIAILFFLVAFLSFPSRSFASDFKTRYDVDYYLSEEGQTLSTHAVFNLKVTNLRSDVFVSQVALAFPKSFDIRNLSAKDSIGEVKPDLVHDDKNIQVNLTFREPNVGRDSINAVEVSFDQTNLFQVNGNIWEVIIPTVEDKEKESYTVRVHLPASTERKISIAKPKPSSIEGDVITWENPTSKTIYAVFGNNQYYSLKLQYHLQNTKITPAYTEIAFPPDTAYQKTYISSIRPPPEYAYRDEDGNFLGRYKLGPKENKDVSYEGTTELAVQGNSEAQKVLIDEFSHQKKYLLTQSPYWTISNMTPYTALKNVKDVYNYTVSKLSYNYERVNSGPKRMGADAALMSPNEAVCVEFADVFVALAREKGIFSREVEGYGFSNDAILRPLSLVTDVLHSWPEYYSEPLSRWVSLDPTWENTSGIDYFSSFDLNHITFAIHGKRADYPLAAGMYKVENTKDITVRPTFDKPVTTLQIRTDDLNIPSTLTDTTIYKTKLIVRNMGNSYLWNVPVLIDATNLKTSLSQTVIPVIVPYGFQEIPLELHSSQRNQKVNASLKVRVLGNEVYKSTFTVIPYYYDLAIKMVFLIIGFAVIMGVVHIVRRKKEEGIN
ncbi:MAG: transglutaminase-like domain-containing protein [bacterium]|nr:transglutaminase-like domain-containing protein [bacterium]